MGSSVDPGEHKRRVAAVYNLASAGYGKPALRFFRLCADRLIDLAGIRSGQSVLDVATGTGLAAIAAARAVGAAGRVVGVDIAEDMLAMARRNAAETGMTHADFRIADAEHLPFPDQAFDAAVCAAGIFFVPNMPAAVRECRRVVTKAGRLAFSMFGDTAFQPMSDLYEARIRAYGISFPVPRRPFSWQRLSDPAKCRSLLEDAGCTDVQIREEQLGYGLRSTDEWWDIVWNSGFRGPVSQLSAHDVERFRREHLAEIDGLATRREIRLDIPAIFALGLA
jgi:arsenite methyltransferase